MISSIVVNGMYDIKVNGNNKIKVYDTILHTENDIPFVRYRLQQYGEAEIQYIKEMQIKFPKSTHLVEMHIEANTVEEFKALREQLSVAIFLYMDITEEMIKQPELANVLIQKLGTLQECNFDRYMLKDESITMDFMAADKIITQISKTYKIKKDNIGICGSPLSFKGLQCLSAVKARELMSIYNEHSDVPLPSANHECMNCCGCIRYLVVNGDLEAPSEGPKKSTKKSSEGSENKEPKQQKKKADAMAYRPGMFDF